MAPLIEAIELTDCLRKWTGDHTHDFTDLQVAVESKHSRFVGVIEQRFNDSGWYRLGPVMRRNQACDAKGPVDRRPARHVEVEWHE